MKTVTFDPAVYKLAPLSKWELFYNETPDALDQLPGVVEHSDAPFCWFHEKSATVHRTSFPPSLNCFPLYTHPAPSQSSAEALVQAALEAALGAVETVNASCDAQVSALEKAWDAIRAMSAQQIIESCTKGEKS